MTKKEKKFRIICEKFIQSPPKYRMRIVLPQLVEAMNELSYEKRFLLNEDFLEDLSGQIMDWVGGTGAHSVWERVVDKILDGMGMEDGILRDSISVILANSNLYDIPGILTDCQKMTDLVISNLPEIITKYISKKFVEDDIFSVTIRKSIIDFINSSDFSQNIKGSVENIVCDAYESMGDSLKNAFSEYIPSFAKDEKEPKKFNYK